MPVVDQKAGSCYVWVITTSLFVCIAAGGILLAIYMNQDDASSWYPIAGFTLVCLPWFFWFLTFLYRFLSRRLGFRMVCWGASPDSLPRTATSTVAAVEGTTADDHRNDTAALEDGHGGATTATGTADEGRRVHFGGTVVLGDKHDGDESTSSHESEAPLRYSMAS